MHNFQPWDPANTFGPAKEYISFIFLGDKVKPQNRIINIIRFLSFLHPTTSTYQLLNFAYENR